MFNQLHDADLFQWSHVRYIHPGIMLDTFTLVHSPWSHARYIHPGVMLDTFTLSHARYIHPVVILGIFTLESCSVHLSWSHVPYILSS